MKSLNAREIRTEINTEELVEVYRGRVRVNGTSAFSKE
jgi:hypothetical protein